METRPISSSKGENLRGQAERNYGVDALRIIAMWMVTLLHVLGQGGVLEHSEPPSANFGAAWLLETAAFCAVNCYALISGYVGYGRKVRYANMLVLILQQLFYTVSATAFFACFMPGSVGITSAIKAALPVVYGLHWYLTAYFCMFFFMPFLNMLLQWMDRFAFMKLALTIMFFSVVSTLLHADVGRTSYGYDAVWLALLYLVGGAIAKYRIADRIRPRFSILGYVACVLVTWLSAMVLGYGGNYFLGSTRAKTYLIRYTSPTILFCAVFLVMFFIRIPVNMFWKRLIAFFAPVSFGVYLIHEEPLITKNLIEGRLADYSALHPVLMVAAVLGTAFGIWIICSLIDHVRLAIFNALKIKKKCTQLECRVREGYTGLIHKIAARLDHTV